MLFFYPFYLTKSPRSCLQLVEFSVSDGGPQVSRQQFETYGAQHLYSTATFAFIVHGNFKNSQQQLKISRQH